MLDLTSVIEMIVDDGVLGEDMRAVKESRGGIRVRLLHEIPFFLIQKVVCIEIQFIRDISKLGGTSSKLVDLVDGVGEGQLEMGSERLGMSKIEGNLDLTDHVINCPISSLLAETLPLSYGPKDMNCDLGLASHIDA